MGNNPVLVVARGLSGLARIIVEQARGARNYIDDEESSVFIALNAAQGILFDSLRRLVASRIIDRS
jgi:hypothetical protein